MCGVCGVCVCVCVCICVCVCVCVRCVCECLHHTHARARCVPRSSAGCAHLSGGSPARRTSASRLGHSEPCSTSQRRALLCTCTTKVVNEQEATCHCKCAHSRRLSRTLNHPPTRARANKQAPTRRINVCSFWEEETPTGSAYASAISAFDSKFLSPRSARIMSAWLPIIHPLYTVAIGHFGMSPPCSLISSRDVAMAWALEGSINAIKGTWARGEYK